MSEDILDSESFEFPLSTPLTSSHSADDIIYGSKESLLSCKGNKEKLTPMMPGWVAREAPVKSSTSQLLLLVKAALKGITSEKSTFKSLSDGCVVLVTESSRCNTVASHSLTGNHMKSCRSISANATLKEVHQSLVVTQNLLLEMCRKYRLLTKYNQLLENHMGRGHKGKTLGNLTEKELKLVKQKEEICTLGQKYSAVYCLWINSEIFLLHKKSKIDLLSSKHWLFLLSIEDGVKTEIYDYVPSICTSLWYTRTSALINYIWSEPNVLLSWVLVIHKAHLLCPPDNLKPEDSLKTIKLVQVLRVALFSKSSIDDFNSLLMTPQAIFVLSDNPNIFTKGEKTMIPYFKWHNFTHSLLLEDTPGTLWIQTAQLRQPPMTGTAMQNFNIGFRHLPAPPPLALPVATPAPIPAVFIPPQAPPLHLLHWQYHMLSQIMSLW
ncbi:hypothetical protein PAXINDRAFT_157571 [Paxillus involutus ATCC 200175]|uniref:Uncharacterized protein n=1 Tax=Paxillus involutus ATCC 200175 TaxID=664439 RepID=A0A0C9T4M0_PAXIN|nr:hypothetical protein PAXINDRAFT_157571 [Paxillus involutus ATCC 200175]